MEWNARQHARTPCTVESNLCGDCRRLSVQCTGYPGLWNKESGVWLSTQSRNWAKWLEYSNKEFKIPYKWVNTVGPSSCHCCLTWWAWLFGVVSVCRVCLFFRWRGMWELWALVRGCWGENTNIMDQIFLFLNLNSSSRQTWIHYGGEAAASVDNSYPLYRFGACSMLVLCTRVWFSKARSGDMGSGMCVRRLVPCAMPKKVALNGGP